MAYLGVVSLVKKGRSGGGGWGWLVGRLVCLVGWLVF